VQERITEELAGKGSSQEGDEEAGQEKEGGDAELPTKGRKRGKFQRERDQRKPQPRRQTTPKNYQTGKRKKEIPKRVEEARQRGAFVNQIKVKRRGNSARNGQRGPE